MYIATVFTLPTTVCIRRGNFEYVRRHLRRGLFGQKKKVWYSSSQNCAPRYVEVANLKIAYETKWPYELAYESFAWKSLRFYNYNC